MMRVMTRIVLLIVMVVRFSWCERQPSRAWSRSLRPKSHGWTQNCGSG